MQNDAGRIEGISVPLSFGESGRDVVGVLHVVCFYWLVAVGTEGVTS